MENKQFDRLVLREIGERIYSLEAERDFSSELAHISKRAPDQAKLVRHLIHQQIAALTDAYELIAKQPMKRESVKLSYLVKP